MIGSKKTKAVEPKLSFADRLGKVKSMFVSAYNETESLSNRIAETSELVKNTETYMSKLKEFI